MDVRYGLRFGYHVLNKTIMKTKKLTITESLLGWFIDLFMRKARTEKTERSPKFHPEVMARSHW
jgi:hypothetical protein